MTTHARLELNGPIEAGFDEILTPDALEFVAELEHRFGPRRRELLEARARRRARLRAGEMLDFLPETREIREGDWTVAPAPPDLQQRWVEITGPTDRKMTINALNSGADGFMADFEDANAPTWHNMVDGHRNLRDAIDGTITYRDSEGKFYELGENPATLLVRPRGWHLPERHLLVDSEPVSGVAVRLRPVRLPLRATASCARAAGRTSTCPRWSPISRRGCGTTCSASPRSCLGIPRGTIKATVLIETLPAAFEMDEILYELREHSAGLNAGRWDYIFSAIKCFPDRPEMVLPDRADVTMTVPFMRAYTELLAATCHRRGAHAMGGMAALIPSRKGDRGGQREGPRGRAQGQGARGLPGLRRHLGRAPRPRAGGARGVRDRASSGKPNQLDRQRDDVQVSAAELLDLPRHTGRDHREGPAHRRQRGLPVHLVLADRPRRRGDQLDDGGRRDRRDLPLADLAVDPPRRRSSRTARP